MISKKFDFVIINRSFWPQNEIIGEALLQLGEKISDKSKNVAVITQHPECLKKISKKFERGKKLTFYNLKSRVDSSSKFIYRVTDTLRFAFWVAWCLIITRPKKIYISTDPPLSSPFIVFMYSKLFRASYVYHLQDIHPEAISGVVNINPLIYSLLKKIDSLVMRHATHIITISETMRSEIFARTNINCDISLIDNPTIECKHSTNSKKIKGFVFSGNIGRQQRIPLLLESIEKYKSERGKLSFIFIGDGVYADQIKNISLNYDDIDFVGRCSAKKSNELASRYEWGLLPIEDKATRYAFPSKTSSYLACGINILSICSKGTSLAKWVLENNYGINAQPNVESIVEAFFKVEGGVKIRKKEINSNKFKIERFVQKISDIIENDY